MMNTLHSCSYWSRCFYDVCYWHPILITLHWYLKRVLFLINICKKINTTRVITRCMVNIIHRYLLNLLQKYILNVYTIICYYDCNYSSDFVIWIPVIYIFIRRFKQKNIFLVRAKCFMYGAIKTPIMIK